MSAKSMSRSLVLCESEDEAVAAMPLVLCKSEFETAAELAEKQPKSVSDGDDFMGSAASIKALFTLPFAGSGSRPHEVLAVHRVGDALVFEDIHEIAASAALGSSRGVEVEEEEQSVIHLLQALAEPPEAFAQDHMAPSLLPSAEWLLPAPQRPLHTFHWKFNQYNIVVGSDVEVYRGDGAHPAVSLRQHESGTMWEPCTALDAYLDNIMGAIPELCLSLESKGFIQGYKLLPTATIPSADVSDSSPSGKLLEAPLFDSADVEMNATMLMKFLQANCKRDGSTYLLQREPAEDPDAAPDSIRLYDLSAMSQAPSRKWKWLLSMLCFRFASRLRLRALDPRGGEESTEFRETLSMRQRELLETCLALLTQLADLGGHGHDMIRASVYDQLAESYTRPAVVSKPNNPSAENALSGHAPFSGDTATAKPKDLQGWPGWEQEEELKNVRVDDLEKALLNLSRGIVVFEGLLQSKALEETEDDDEGAEEDNDIDESVRSDLCRLRLRAAEVGLALASRQIASWQASSAMSNLRDLSSKYLLPLVRECNEDTYNAAVAEVISWLWIQTGRFARAVAMDRDSWIDKSGMVAGDVLLLLNELSGILDDSSFNGPSLYNVRFSDRNGWQHLADLEASGIALPSLGPRPSGDDTLLRDRHTASTLPLSVACALCAARALHSTLSASSNANCKAARLLKSRLGDACNEVGKQLMASAEYARLWYAVVWFGRGLAVFRDIGDKTNSALLLCNLASVKKLAAGRLEASEMELFEALLDESINDCTAAQSSLEVRGAAPHAWDFIAKELAMAYLTLGVRRRKLLLAEAQKTVGPVTPGASRRVSEPIEKACKIYESLGDEKQVAASKYQIGTLWSRLWTRAGDQRRSKEQLALALSNYEAAYKFYKANGGGKILLLINLDIADLYCAVHAASGQGGSRQCLEKAALCLTQTQASFRAEAQDASELRELLRLSQSVSERLPKVLLLLAKVTASAAKGQEQLLQVSPGTCVDPDEANRANGYKKLYRDALTFPWPKAEVFEVEATAAALDRTAIFLDTAIRPELSTLRHGHVKSR